MALPDWLAADPRVRHVHRREPAIAIPAGWPSWVPADVLAMVAAAGITEPWRHQIEAAESLFRGRHVALGTPTASGKSLAYLLPILTATAAEQPTVGWDPEATDTADSDEVHVRSSLRSRSRLRLGLTPSHSALYIAPTKALAHDQLRVCREFGGPSWRVSTLDGDSDSVERRFARDFAAYVLTNPDMLHRSVLPNHERWRRFLGSLRYVVLDESHRYRGVFGAHVAQVLRRLRRLCHLYGADPVFLCSSATATEGLTAASRLIGVEPGDVAAVDWDASPRGARDVVLWQPVDGLEQEVPELLAGLVGSGRQTLAFLSSRKGAELTALKAQRIGKAEQIAAYRSGYLADDRRLIESQLQSGKLRGVAATNALELGVDIAGMDAVIVAGFPGTLASFWQQAGRAGRRGSEATVVLVAKEDPLDAYLFEHPELLFEAPVERVVLHPENPYVLAPHLAAAAQELPLSQGDERWFGPTLANLLEQMAGTKVLRRRGDSYFWTHPHRAVDSIDLRNIGGSPMDIVDAETGRVVGSVDPAAADLTVHPGAVYLHQGEEWLVDGPDAEGRQVLARRTKPGYYTQPRSESSVRIIDTAATRRLGVGQLSLGRVELTSQVTSFLRRDELSGKVLDQTPLDLPERKLLTASVWWTLDADRLEVLELDQLELAGAAHGAEHTAIGMLPVFAPCDRWDIGGLSTLLHPDTGQLTVFVHDAQPGGAGFAAAGYAAAEEWLTATLARLDSCRCESGCPACVVSPKCGNGNQMLDKSGARLLLRTLLG